MCVLSVSLHSSHASGVTQATPAWLLTTLVWRLRYRLALFAREKHKHARAQHKHALASITLIAESNKQLRRVNLHLIICALYRKRIGHSTLLKRWRLGTLTHAKEHVPARQAMTFFFYQKDVKDRQGNFLFNCNCFVQLQLFCSIATGLSHNI